MNRERHLRLPAIQRRWVSVVLGGYLVMMLNSLLLLVFSSSTALVYMSLMLLHIGLGIALMVPVGGFLTMHLRKMPIRLNRAATRAGVLTALALVLLFGSGLLLTGAGATLGGGSVRWLHIGTTVAAVLGFGIHLSLKRGVRFHFLEWGTQWREHPRQALRHPLTLTLLTGTLVTMLVVVLPLLQAPSAVYVEVTPEAGAHLPVLGASQAVLNHNGFLEEQDLARSKTCGQQGCHPDVYAQWAESAHRFSSFNNPYYRKSIENMVSRSGEQATRWCASCHDPVVLFSGRFGHTQPLDMNHWTGHEGLTCLSCHAIEGLYDLKGNGRYVLRAPDEYPFARSEEGIGRWLHNQLLRAHPEPHRRAMLKSVHRTAAFCGSCHKVGLPPEVNNYRWKRGQNEYDTWHASGVSGHTVRSFYLPTEGRDCFSCHMPLVPSQDQGSDQGLIRSHRFAAANTALPFLNGHPYQLKAIQHALADSIVTIDLFQAIINGKVYGPEAALPLLQPGDQVALDVVVRNRKVGHALPGGTNDANEVWIELVGQDARGQVVLASGLRSADGQLDSTAHVFGAVAVDRDGRMIDKRNAQDWITNVYLNVIGPGTARTVHYHFTVPPGASISRLTARLQHRKFRWYFNEWTFRGQVAPGEPASAARPEVDRRRWILDEREAPDLPVTTLATARRTADRPPEAARPRWERWNDYGIGLLLEGDTRGALAAFETVSALAPDNPEGPLNQTRVFLEEGQLDRARAALDEAERRQPRYLKIAWFRGEYLKDSGHYPEALAEWMRVHEAYPEDRVLLLGIGRLHYLSGRYDEALAWFDRVLAIDPEDTGGLYNRMLALGALGREAAFAEARKQYAYYKEDEEALAVAAPYKQRHPMANREAQLIHTHELTPPPSTAKRIIQTPVRNTQGR